MRLYRSARIEFQPGGVLFRAMASQLAATSVMSIDRSANAKRVVSRDPDVLSGKLVFAGTRVPVQVLIDYLKAGETLDRFLEGFPTVDREQAETYLEMTLKDAESHA